MATSLEQIQVFLDEYDLRYHVDEEREAILIGFGIDPDETTFRDRQGEPHVGLVIRPRERGEFLSIFCPWAWNLDGCPHKASVFEAAAAIQGRYKMLRFDYDPTDGELRPNVELPVEDGDLTSQQFHRLMQCLFCGIQRFDRVIRHAMQTGEVSLAWMDEDDSGGDSTAEMARLQKLAAEAGGLEALERIACGSCGDEPTEEPTAEAAARPVRPAQEQSQAEAAAPAPKPVIRRIWDRFFGPDGPEAGTGRRAG